ncbi:unnamed protein product [Rhodiola kirilowii]
MDENAALEYVTFRILPNRNRYQAFACDGNKEELLVEGLLEPLTQHLPQLKDFYSGGSEANVKLHWPRSSSVASWFSKSTIRRFLSIANSAELFNEIKAIEDEMSQLEKARSFHLSLYSQGHQHISGSGKADGRNTDSSASESKSESEVEIVSSDPSKNELLRAMDSRLKALREELAGSLEKAAADSCSSKDISHLVNCCQNLGAMALKMYLIKYSELIQITLILDNPSDKKPTFVNAVGCDDETETGENRSISKLGQPVVHVHLGGSPAKVAQVERDDTTDKEDSSDDIDVDATERSRSVVRSVTPRRSASPMRRVQIARVGSRRATAIGIRSLNNFPIRERISNHTDGPTNSSDEEVSEKPLRKHETSVQRMSVQAAISLFESKQREENGVIQNKSLGDISKNVKPVLRKWNSCVEQPHVQCSAEAVTENHSFSSASNQQDTKTQEVHRQEPQSANGDIDIHQTGEIDATIRTPDILESAALNIHDDTTATQVEESTERLVASAKWNQQKEAELSMLMKMIEVKPVKQRRPATSKNNTSEQRGGLYDDYKKKRDEKLRGENSTKRAEREAQLKAMHQIVEKSKVDMSSKDGRRQSLRKSLPSATPPSVNPKKESPNDTKPTTAKRETMKPSSLPATRKSWPSTPPPQSARTSPLPNSSTSSSTATTARRKCQTPQSLARPNLKAEKPLLQKNAKGLQTERRTSSQGAITTHRQPWIRDTNPTKSKIQASSKDVSDMAPAKTGLPSKGTKKSSVVPIESKLFLREGSKVGSAVVPAGTKRKIFPHSKESVRRSIETPPSQEKEVVAQSPEQVDKHEIKYFIDENAEVALVSEIPVASDKKTIDPETPRKDNADGSINLAVVDDPSLTVEKEETTISPSAWVEVEESDDLPIMPIPIDDSEVQFAYPPSINSAEMATSPRVRQSLSQMLQEEINELENNTEWGNAEHPPGFYQKDAPKGFKRLLNFARKSKGDGNSSGWSSPTVFSEGDDDAEDFKAGFQRNTDNRLRKATHHTKSTSQHKSLLREGGLERKDSSGKYIHEISNNPQRSSYQMGEGHNSSGISGTKSSRSFFSLSAFRGSK